MHIRTLIAVAASALAIAFAQPALAQLAPQFVPLPPAMGALYKPDSGPAPHVALLVMHRTANYMTHIACTELSKRGFLVLCMNSRYLNNEEFADWDNIALDVKAGVTFLRKQPGITKVVLFGHSGGGPVMSYYEAVAENGPAYCNTPRKLVPCRSDALANLPGADGIVFVDAHPGQPIIVTRGLDPALPTDVSPPTGKRIADVDAFDPKNGYNPAGESNYSPEFIKRFFAAQAARMTRLTDDALRRRDAIKAHAYGYPDDDLVVVPGGGNPGPGPGGALNLNALERNIPVLNTTAHPEKLLRNDGSVERRIVTSVVAPDADAQATNTAFDSGTKLFSIKSFLGVNAIRGGDGLFGYDYCSVNNSTWCAVESIHVPVMFASMGAFVLIRDGEFAYQRSASKDKDYVVIEGALHGLVPCKACETTPGQYSNVTRNLFDYIATWLAARY